MSIKTYLKKLGYTDKQINALGDIDGFFYSDLQHRERRLAKKLLKDYLIFKKIKNENLCEDLIDLIAYLNINKFVVRQHIML